MHLKTKVFTHLNTLSLTFMHVNTHVPVYTTADLSFDRSQNNPHDPICCTGARMLKMMKANAKRAAAKKKE